MTTVITTNVNIENEIKAIKQLEAEIKSLSDIKKDKERLYKRNYCNNLYYTTGILDFAETLNAHWLIDTVVSYIPKVIEEYKKSEETFFLIEVRLNQKQEGYFEIYREGWIGDEYHESITVVRQMIPFIDLPTEIDDEITSYKFYLELSSYNPVIYTLLLPGEH